MKNGGSILSNLENEIVGKRFGRLLILSKLENGIKTSRKNLQKYVCQCDCGVVKNLVKHPLISGRTQSCGCLAKELASLRFKKKHDRNHPSYSSWMHMKSRCNNPNEAGYEGYGGRGIFVCERWEDSYDSFIDDVGYAPTNHVADRIDPNGNYVKENFRWVNRSLSSFNTRKASNNTSGRTGVYWFERVSKWIASIYVNNKQIHLGYFDTFEAAVKSRVDAELLYFNELKGEDRCQKQ